MRIDFDKVLEITPGFIDARNFKVRAIDSLKKL